MNIPYAWGLYLFSLVIILIQKKTSGKNIGK